ncbi:cytochrome-c oxidase, cbb3-type subunit II [Pseudoduganella lutea]|uniref:Cytochrome-c oxidase, cbb3-type subunit II n=1 Tax=Pseudoduganella lutea TaxID=321985 RepID=A0A4P6KYA9_9BURK|nr:cytochrome-c oxidase, cbb3-type subunit II [Pseudoduganella lutea]QBE63844.1 cytochrome-c oxidase, cbb3-type subunit II [Pseudoduganella lutea]
MKLFRNFSHEWIEKNPWLLIALVTLVVSVGGAVEIVPLFFQRSTTEPVAGLERYSPLRLAGRDIYVREGCYACHSQMVRPFRAETERYGHYSVAGEFVFDRPFQWGSKRTGPDLARVGARYSDEWHRTHLRNPRDMVPESNMPGYPWLAQTKLAPQDIVPRLRALQRLGDGYTDAEIAAAPAALAEKTEEDALVAYLQGLGTLIKSRN